MPLYAELPGRRTRQLISDALALAAIVLSVLAGRAVHRAVSALAAPGREMQEAGDGLTRSLEDVARRTAEVPLVGDSLAGALGGPFTAAGDAARRLAEAGAAEQAAVGQLATVLGLAGALLPIALVLLAWLPLRVGWARRATEARRLRDMAAGATEVSRTADPGLELLALRALARQPLRKLLKADPAPAAALRTGDRVALERLAALELAGLGLRAPDPAPSSRPTARSRPPGARV